MDTFSHGADVPCAAFSLENMLRLVDDNWHTQFQAYQSDISFFWRDNGYTHHWEALPSGWPSRCESPGRSDSDCKENNGCKMSRPLQQWRESWTKGLWLCVVEKRHSKFLSKLPTQDQKRIVSVFAFTENGKMSPELTTALLSLPFLEARLAD